MAEGEGTQALTPPSALKQGLAALIAVAAVMLGATLAAQGLRGVVDESVRTGAVGLLFGAVPPVYAFANRALNGFRSPRLELPELYPWYVTGIVAGAALFAWIQFVALATGFAYAAIHGGEDVDPQRLAAMAGVLVLPLLAPAAFIAGGMINRSTRAGVVFSVLIAVVLCAGLSVFTTWRLAPEVFDNIVRSAATSPAATILASMGPPCAVVLVFAALGVAWSSFRRERSIARVAHAMRRLAPDQRPAVLADVTRALAKTARERPAPQPAPPPAAAHEPAVPAS